MDGNYEIGKIVFGDWKLKKEIGKGSYGRVFEAERRSQGTIEKSAIKIITIPQTQDEVSDMRARGMRDESVTTYFKSFVEEIVQEFELLSKLQGNTNIADYQDHQVIEHENEIGWDILIRMELLTPLLDYTASHPLTQREVAKLGADICKALAVCRKKNIVHRDIKPANIFVSAHGDFKLGDFGIARTIEKTTGGLSRKGTFMYMAPEVYKAQQYGANVDICSLGLVMYRFLNDNRDAFLPMEPVTVSSSICDKAIAKRMRGEPLEAPVGADAELAQIVLKACAYDPRERYRNAEEMLRALENCCGTEFPPLPPLIEEERIPEPAPIPIPNPPLEPVPEPTSDSSPEPVPEPTSDSSPEPVPEPTSDSSPEPVPNPDDGGGTVRPFGGWINENLGIAIGPGAYFNPDDVGGTIGPPETAGVSHFNPDDVGGTIGPTEIAGAIRPQKSKRGVWIGIASVAAAAIIVGVIIVKPFEKSDKVPETPMLPQTEEQDAEPVEPAAIETPQPIKINLNKLELEKTATQKLYVEGDSNGVTWTSSDEKIATVEADGTVKAIGAGATTIVASAGDGSSAFCTVIVTEPETEEPNTNDDNSEIDITGAAASYEGVDVAPKEVLDTPETRYLTASVNLRKGPSTSYGIITSIGYAKKVDVMAREGNWSFVQTDGKYGWIVSDYLSSKKPSSGTNYHAEATSGSLRY